MKETTKILITLVALIVFGTFFSNNIKHSPNILKVCYIPLGDYHIKETINLDDCDQIIGINTEITILNP